MKKTRIAIALCLLVLHGASAISSLPFYEPFPESYGSAVIGTGSSATVWSIGNTGSSGGAFILGFGVTYPDLANSEPSESLYIYGTPTSNRNKGAPFNPQTLSSSNRTIYVSFLLQVYTPPTSSRLFATLSSTGSGTTPSVSAGVWLEPSGRLLISKNSSIAPVATNQVNVADFGIHLVVLRYRWNSSINDDEVALWVDPSGLGLDESSVPVSPTTTTFGADVPTFQSFFINHTTSAAVTAELLLDEIRVATNWAGVTPTQSGLPIPLRRPRITSAILNGNGIEIHGTNGSPNGAFLLLTAANINAPAYQWNNLGTRLFDASGNFDCTNAIASGEPRQFYRLLAGGAIPTLPVILVQPTNQVALVGQNATFAVAADGDPPLIYQWYFNTNTLLPGQTASTLVITNAQFSNAGGYSVVVGNASGSITSVVATLTVNSISSGPSITAQPHSLVVTQGQNASFTVTATGNPTPTYQWYFNTNTLLTYATDSTLTLTNVQSFDAGAYSVVVANTNGSVTSSNAILTVLVPPAITTQPFDQTVIAGQPALFSVGAIGTAPLTYQWYFNTNILLFNATNSTLSATNAGGYSVVIANSIGSVTSVVAMLTLIPPPTNSGPIGYAMVNGSTTGGAGGSVVTVSDPGDFEIQIADSTPRVIQVQGTLAFGLNIRIGSNKTIVGLGTNATIVGDLDLVGSTNVIIRNLFITNPSGTGDGDGMTIEDLSEHIWVDHCTFVDCMDGELDITHGSDYITVSWCKFQYTANTGHNFVNLLGHSENNSAEDTGKLHVTFHHNWWSTLCIERMPRVRFGRAHVFNNYYDCAGNNYCLRAGYLSEILAENNYFDQINTPYEYFFEIPGSDPPAAGLINAVGNTTFNCTNVGIFNDPVFTPPYSYTAESPAAAKTYALFGAGAGTPLFP